ncbi:hypothetical protein C4Q31_07545 [Leptospira borgpetersenii serovar Ceylonica]|uniref:Uncharacterized protein n=1 Tax=Leptospira borgpetersenii str. 200701203 TaxID=1193007 RepID=M3FGX1_LEPBO|nr:hypothetical protein C4Q31_07545 [Leptospira borgpetersenii serovar Ceylonica]EMG01088.1 hypothetical protein LEP1GSC123_3884 [Leptospira borgpetersenii str. 200701203]KGE24909.1 hypothetical protein IQ66_06155 [Leptospira borgpetersenii serovar Ballum]QHE25983.1 hypothetical protein GS524_02520 [Leptospira borgpetersenii]QHE29286.1 hypothetical protein GS523_02525 [Leptospira borgpetersenii]
MCETLEISRIGYYDWLKREDSERTKSNRGLDGKIRGLFYKEHEDRCATTGSLCVNSCLVLTFVCKIFNPIRKKSIRGMSV